MNIELDIAEMVERSDEKMRLLKAVKALKPKERLMLTMRYYDNLSFQEIAEIMQFKLNEVHELHRKILKALKQNMNEDNDDKR
jgi:RNA polymerase sigma factor (sigma-70 family)